MSNRTKMMILVALLALSVAACTGVQAGSATVTAPAPTPQTGELSEPLQTSLKATLELPATLPSGESVNLTFILVNAGDEALYVLNWYTPLEGLAGEIFRVERDGQVIPYQGILASRVAPLESDYVLLGAGESVSAEVDLATAYDFSAAGEYTIEFISPRISHVARTEADMTKTMDDLGPIQILSKPARVLLDATIPSPEDTPDVPTVVPSTAEGEDDAYPGWESYVNPEYGFGFRYPSAWTLEEEANLVKLSHGTLRLAIAFQVQGEDVPPPWTGMPAGEFESRGTVEFLGQQPDKNALVYEGKVKALTYNAQVGDKVFSIQLDDMAAVDYSTIEIPGAIQSQVDQILGTFEMR